MKKPRKSRPKTKQPRCEASAVASRRAPASSRQPAPAAPVARQGPKARQPVRTAADRLASGVASCAKRIRAPFVFLAKAVRRRTPGGLGTAAGRPHASAPATLGTYSREEHEVFALLFLPFLLVASAMVLHQSLRTIERHLTAIAVPDQEVLPLAPEWTQDVRLASAPQMPAHAAPPLHTDLAAIRTAPEPLVVAGTGQALAAAPFGIDATAVAAAVIEPRPMRERTGAMPAPLSAAPVSAAATPAREETELALLGPVGGPGRSLAPRTPDPIETLEAGGNGKPIRTGVCSVPEPRPAVSEALSLGQTLRPTDPSAFGLSLARAAESQVGGLVIYNDAYRNISYPMGDVNRLFGVCTDVVVRAYRALGLDLQALVHEARAGTGDTSIDHRRTEILRRFFAARGESLPITTFPEDYRPGDIVTYHRPQNRGARAHIAIVSSVVAPSGRLMIVHNRGWGPELEDALFVDQITGHYRYRGPAATRNAVAGGRGSQAWAVTAPVRPAAYATERHGPEAR